MEQKSEGSRVRAGLSLAGLIALAALLVLAGPALAKKKKPDLAVTSVAVPTSVEVGKAFDVADVVKNAGRKRAKKSAVTYYLSDSAAPGKVVIGSRSVPKLKPKKKSAGSARLSVPAQTKPADYFVVACVAGKFKEKTKRNNCKAASIRTTAADPVKPTEASLSIDPASGTLTPTLVGDVSPITTFTVSNDGGKPSGPISTQAGGAPFSIAPATDECTGTALAPGASCTFGAAFAPTARGPAQSQVSVQAEPGGSLTAPISGVGLAPASISLSDSSGPAPESWDFGTTLVDADSASHNYTVKNDGDVPTGALTVGYSGASFSQFEISGGTCLGGVTLGAGATCTVITNFHPTSAGAKETTLGVSGTPGGAVSTRVTGTGQTASRLVLSPILHNYGGVPFNSHADFTFTINNAGGMTSSAISLSISGTNADRFQVLTGPSDTCTGQTLDSGELCSFTVRFDPNNIGARTASLNYSATVGGSGSAPLSGNGT